MLKRVERGRAARAPVKELKRAAWLCAALLALWSPAFAGDEPSKAEILLFQTNHLAFLENTSRLTYEFHKQGDLEPGFGDRVEIVVNARDGKKSVSTNYLSGSHKSDFPAVDDAHGNPVLMYFLERDIREMQRLTGGHWIFFKKRIRMALADDAIVRPVSFLYDGAEAKGQEVRITPFAGDPLRPKFEKFADKYYVFTLSDAVPGGVYQLRAVVPPEKTTGAEKPLMEETLTFSKVARE